MPKLKLQVSEHQIAMLRHKVESQLGRPLRDISDARILSEALATSIGQSLSVSTKHLVTAMFRINRLV